MKSWYVCASLDRLIWIMLVLSSRMMSRELCSHGAVSMATEVLGNADKARRWLKSPNRALGGEVPFDLLDTEIGAHQVEEVLVRLNHGLFS